MFTVAILIGISSYLIFILGLLRLLYKPIILFSTLVCLFTFIYLFKNWLILNLIRFFEISKKIHYFFSIDKLSQSLIVLLFLQGIINLVGVLGPELGFDALWYHLTLPKIYLDNHSIEHITGGLLYYSAMPKLTEMLYTGALAFGNEIFAKLIHFSFGILCLITLYKLSRKFFTTKLSIVVITIFYSNLVVGWMSITAYIDLARTFFEIMALWGFINWLESKEKKWLIESGIMLGLAISTKLLAIGSLFIFFILIIYFFTSEESKRRLLRHNPRWFSTFGQLGGGRVRNLFFCLLAYLFISILIPLPWFVFAFINSGNPFYPIFENIYPININLNFINPLKLSDPINPLYVVLMPIAILLFSRQTFLLKIISIYSILSFLIWQLTPNTGGGRFIMPYLPAFSILTVWVIREIWKMKIKPFIVGLVVFFLGFSIIYRLGANLKYIPILVGIQSKSYFLTKNLNFSYGDYYYTDG